MSPSRYYFTEEMSLRYCQENFSHYACFATLPLRIAFWNGDFNNTYEDFTWSWRNSGENHSRNARLRGLMRDLVYDDSDFFDTEELRFFLRFENIKGCHSRETRVMKKERTILVRESKSPTRILPSH